MFYWEETIHLRTPVVYQEFLVQRYFGAAGLDDDLSAF